MNNMMEDAISRAYAFSENGRELIIKTPKLHRPWYNYLSGANYGLRFSQTGGGFSVHPILEGRRITRYHGSDESGRHVYVYDLDDDELWSLNWHPVCRDLDRFECRHGLGYSQINSERKGVAHSLRVMTLRDDPGEMWTITFRNLGDRTRNLAFFPYLEWDFGQNDALWDNPVWYTRAEFIPRREMIQASFFDPANKEGRYDAFMKALFPVSGYCCSKRNFCGFNGSLRLPEGVRNEDFKHGLSLGDAAIACFKKTFSLEAGESAVFQLIVGCGKDGAGGDSFVSRYDDQGRRVAAAREIDDYWRAVVTKHAVATPDHVFDRWINVWLKYQEHQCFRWAGLGEPNSPLMGYRDVLQHVLAMNLFDPDMARARLIEALRHQYRNGRAIRAWSRKGNHDRRDYRDSPVWIIFALCGYLKEVHDFALLEETIPYLDGEGEDTVLAHARNALKALIEDRGAHGLSHIGEGDWYDPLNNIGRKGRGESVWLSMALVAALKEMAELLAYMEKFAEADGLRKTAGELSDRINECAWDGAWYLQAFDDQGAKVGGWECDEGRIFANPQIWAVISGVASDERARKSFDSLDELLRTPFGYKIVNPPYTFRHRDYGNVGIQQGRSRAYAHVSAFKMIADCMLGRGDEAYRTFARILPTNPLHPPEKTFADPHIIPNGYTGVDDNAHAGVVLHSGSSGAFPWILKAVIEYLFGIRADYEGLRVRPCLPAAWRQASIRRQFRGATYNFVIDSHGCHGAPKLVVDGIEHPGTLIKPDAGCGEHAVEVHA